MSARMILLLALCSAAAQNPKPSPAMNAAPGTSRTPVVVWTRDMSHRVRQPVRQTAPDPPGRSRDRILESLSALHAGTVKAEVIAGLGQPAYSIGIAEGGHYVERCRFRYERDDLAAVEFRDGVVTRIDRMVE